MSEANLDTMLGVSAQVEGLREEIGGLLVLLKQDVQNIVGSWKGDAQTTFVSVMANWDTSAVKLQNALEGINTAIKTSSHQYSSTESENASAITSVAGTMNW